MQELGTVTDTAENESKEVTKDDENQLKKCQDMHIIF